MDPLTEIFSQMRIRNAMFTRLDATAPWGFASEGDPLVKFVLVVRGSGILTTESHPDPICLGGGDLFIMLDDEPYRMFDQESSQLLECVEVEKLRVGNRIEVGGGGAATTFISGFFEMDALDAKPLRSVLPTLLHLTLEQSRSLAFRSILELLAAETEAPGLGSEAAVSRLFELLFVHAIRAYALQATGTTHGWLAAIADRYLGRAIEAIHADPARGWTVATLARVSGMSRSGFAARFKAIVGQTPLDYLTQWRVYRASRLIQKPGAALSEVSRSVGYDSVTAFNRVFKRETGQTPGAFRKAAMQQSAAA